MSTRHVVEISTRGDYGPFASRKIARQALIRRGWSERRDGSWFLYGSGMTAVIKEVNWPKNSREIPRKERL